MKNNFNLKEEIAAKNELECLRIEILESQKARIDLLKYKLFAIAALGAIGLGLGEKLNHPRIDPDVILCIIPFVCIYIDLLCCHNTMRILVIARFLNYSGDPYEKYIGMLGKNNNHHKKGAGYYFELEDFSLHGSSILLGGLLALYGCVILLFPSLLYEVKANTGYLFLFIGIAGVIFTFHYKNVYEKHIRNLFYTAEELEKKHLHSKITNNNSYDIV